MEGETILLLKHHYTELSHDAVSKNSSAELIDQ